MCESNSYSHSFDGVFVSNGPGNPVDVPEVVETIKTLKGEMPIFGTSLGHQLIALAYGAKTEKLKFGHRGSNHPVRNLVTGKVEIANAVEEVFGVNVAKVNTISVRGQERRRGRFSGYTASWKKAVVSLKADSKPIEFFDGLI